jgi:hypothetical protein
MEDDSKYMWSVGSKRGSEHTSLNGKLGVSNQTFELHDNQDTPFCYIVGMTPWRT